MQTVLIAGGTGLVGARLSEILTSRGYKVIHLSRKQNLEAPYPAYAWDIEKGTIDEAVLSQADYVINLAGAGIADKRWTAMRKKIIIESRTQSTALLAQFIKKKPHKIKAYLSASAMGIYGDCQGVVLTEESSSGHGFLAESTMEWEKSIQKIADMGVRTIAFRIGIVLSTKGGALEKMLIPLWFRMAVYFGNGKQWYSWIHIEDVCNMFIWAIEQEKVKGVFNAVAPNPVTNYDLTAAISTAKGGGYLMLPAPALALRLAMGEMADVILNSTRVSSQKVENQGFRFQYREIIPALRDLFK
jgi:uncharacterized protein